MRASALVVTALALCAGRVCAGVINPTEPRFRSQVVFGDSLSDNGNVHRITNGARPADPAFWKGRFSNGPVWVEFLAKRLNAELQDFAVGGSTSDNDVTPGHSGAFPVPSALDQLSQYLGTIKSDADLSDTLFTIHTGANDAYYDFNATYMQSTKSVVTMIERLRERGAKYFLVTSYADMSRLPSRAYTPTDIAAQLHTWSAGFHSEMKSLAGPNVAYADLYSLFADILAYPTRYGYDPTKTAKSCLTGAYSEAPRSLCHDPESYIFWDEFHPTTQTHQLIAEVAERAIQSMGDQRGEYSVYVPNDSATVQAPQLYRNGRISLGK